MSRFDFRNQKTGAFCGFDGVCAVAVAAISPDAGRAVLNLYGFDRVEKIAPPPAEPWQQVVEVEPLFVNNEWQQQWQIINPPLDVVRDIQRDAIQAEYLRREIMPVEHLGRQWKGGGDSGRGIRDATEISAQLEQETVELWDINNDSQHYTLAEARQIAAVIGVAYQQLYAQRAGLRKAIADAETTDDVLAVGWGVAE